MHPGNNQCSYVSNTYRCDLLITSCFSLLNVIVHTNCSFSSFLRVRAKKCRISVISCLHDTTSHYHYEMYPLLTIYNTEEVVHLNMLHSYLNDN